MTLEEDLEKQYLALKQKTDSEIERLEIFQKKLLFFRFIRVIPVMVGMIGLVIYFVLR